MLPDGGDERNVIWPSFSSFRKIDFGVIKVVLGVLKNELTVLFA
jgi:hypothetical protein